MYRDLNPYNRLLQKSIRRQIDSIKNTIYEYRGMRSGDLGYGYSNDIEYIFITGANDIERGIPRFTLPIVDMESRRPTIIRDMRDYSKSNLDGISDDIKDMMLSKSNYFMALTSTLMFGDTIEGGTLLKSEWYKSFSFLVVNVLTNELGLDPYDRTYLHIAILAYMVDTMEGDRDIGSKDFIIANNMLLNGIKIDTDDVKDITSKLTRDNLNTNVLVDNINRCSEDRRLKGLTLDVLIGTINKMVITKDVGSISNGFEYPELVMPLLHTYTNNTFLKRTKLAEGFKYIARKVDMKDVDRELNALIKK